MRVRAWVLWETAGDKPDAFGCEEVRRRALAAFLAPIISAVQRLEDKIMIASENMFTIYFF